MRQPRLGRELCTQTPWIKMQSELFDSCASGGQQGALEFALLDTLSLNGSIPSHFPQLQHTLHFISRGWGRKWLTCFTRKRTWVPIQQTVEAVGGRESRRDDHEAGETHQSRYPWGVPRLLTWARCHPTVALWRGDRQVWFRGLSSKRRGWGKEASC